MSRSTLTPRRTAYPHGSPPHKIYATWSKIVDLTFLACFFLFAPAFLFYDFGPIGLTTTGHLSSADVINVDAPTVYNSTPPSGLYHDALPPNWGPAMATNLTNGNEPGHAFAQKSEPHVLSPSAADDSFDDDGHDPNKQQASTRVTIGDKTPRVETSRTPSVLFSYNAHDRNLATVERVTSWQDSDYNGRDEYVASNMDSDPQAYALQAITPEFELPHFVDDHDASDSEPFLPLEEYDGEREIFALKIWIDKKEFQRARLGKTQYCQASSGIKCLSES